MSRRKYRAKIEILRDVLVAARRGENKTRIMGHANLNWSSLERYLSFCTERDLLLPKNGGFCFTPRAEQTLGVIDLVLARDSELNEALQELEQLTRSGWPETMDSMENLDGMPARSGHLVALPRSGGRRKPVRYDGIRARE